MPGLDGLSRLPKSWGLELRGVSAVSENFGKNLIFSLMRQ